MSLGKTIPPRVLSRSWQFWPRLLSVCAHRAAAANQVTRREEAGQGLERRDLTTLRLASLIGSVTVPRLSPAECL